MQIQPLLLGTGLCSPDEGIVARTISGYFNHHKLFLVASIPTQGLLRMITALRRLIRIISILIFQLLTMITSDVLNPTKLAEKVIQLCRVQTDQLSQI